jgi:hypothetical protein
MIKILPSIYKREEWKWKCNLNQYQSHDQAKNMGLLNDQQSPTNNVHFAKPEGIL